MSKFVFQELHTTDPAAAKKFYGQVFGWTFADMQMANGPYTMIMADGEGLGGIMQTDTGPKWVGYVGVASAKRALNKAIKRGATVMVPYTKVPGMGALAMFADPTGALCAVWEEAKKAAPAAKKKAAKKKAAKKKTAKKRVVKKASKKRAAKKRVAKKTTKKRVAKKATKKRATKKRVAKKRVAKKRVAKKRVAKKATKKRATKKRVAKKAPTKRAAKKRVTRKRRAG